MEIEKFQEIEEKLYAGVKLTAQRYDDCLSAYIDAGCVDDGEEGHRLACELKIHGAAHAKAFDEYNKVLECQLAQQKAAGNAKDDGALAG